MCYVIIIIVIFILYNYITYILLLLLETFISLSHCSTELHSVIYYTEKVLETNTLYRLIVNGSGTQPHSCS